MTTELHSGDLPGQGRENETSPKFLAMITLAEAGDGEIARYIGDCYREGEPVRFSPRRAFRWYVRGAFAGNTLAMNNLAVSYHNGFGTEANIDQAVHWYTRGAKLGDHYAQSNLGRCYLNGYGVKRNRRTAIRWLKAAAKQGNERAKETLAEIEAEEAQDETG